MDVGTVVTERYELVDRLGVGGMGEVWRGFDRHLDRHVAIKFLRGDAFDPDRREQAERRLRREARVTARVQHPGVPIVYDVGSHHDSLFLVLQLVTGLTVDDLIAEQTRLPISWAAAIAAQICAVLTVAHGESVIHRDLKPSNLMLCPDGTIKVLDFGIVAILDPAMQTSKLTLAGEAMGSPAYMAPEYGFEGAISARSDLYSLGCVLHEMLTGTPVFTATHPAAVMAKHYHEDPPRLRELRPDVPEELEHLVLALLAKVPEDRPANAASVFAALLPFVVALPPLPGATAVAPSPDPMRMYATVVGRIAESALVGPTVPEVAARREVSPRRGHVTVGDVQQARREAGALVDVGRISTAIELLRSMVEPAAGALGSSAQLVLALRNDLAGALFMDDDFAAAGPELAALAEEIAQQAGPLNRVALDCRHKAAVCLAGLGRTREALTALEALLADFEAAYTSTGKDTLSLRYEICRLFAVTGQRDLAWPRTADLLIEMRNVYGEDHPETESVRHLLAKLEQLGQ